MFDARWKPVKKVTLGTVKQMQDLETLHRKRMMRLVTVGFYVGLIPPAITALMYANQVWSALAAMAMIEVVTFTALRVYLAKDQILAGYRQMLKDRRG